MEVTVNNTRIHYNIIGSGTPVLMIHGYTLDHRNMSVRMEPLFENTPGWQRIYFDLPGMGLSEPSGHISTSDDMLSIVLGFIEKILPDRDFAIAGLSYGGYLAHAVVKAMADRILGVAFIVPAVNFVYENRSLPQFRVFDCDRELVNSLDDDACSGYKDFCTIQTKETWDQYQKQILPGVSLCNHELTERVRDTELSNKDTPLSRPLEKPALFLLGRFDHCAGYKDAWRNLDDYPRASFVVLDRSGHCLPIDQPRLFDVMIQDWLTRVMET